MDKNGNSIFHCLIPLIFSDNITQNNYKNIINQIIDKLKQNLTEEELDKINNTYDENGLTPLLKIMYQYNNEIYNIYSNIKSKEIYNKKKEKYNLNNQNSNLMNIEGNISYNENYYINNIILTIEEMNEVNNISLKKVDEFIEFILSIIKKFIDLKMNPLLKVGKTIFYRNNPIKVENNTNLTNNDVINLSKKTQIEKQYLNGHAKNNILLYLMKYPSKILLKYFIEELKFPINSYNLYKYNSIFILFDNINIINQFQNVNVTVKDTLKYLIQQGINVNQTDYLGNNPFLYLSKKNFNIELLKILSENKCDINKFNIDDENSLFFYVRKRNLQIVRTLIEEFKVNYNLLDNKKRTIIHYLCNDEISTADMDEKFCDYLLTKRINLNQADILGRTPIHYLFVKLENEYNNNDIDPVITLTKILGYKEVDREHKDIYGNTPLHYACQRGSIISIITLGGKKIDYDIKNKENNSPLAYSFLFKKENIAISLIQLNVNLNQSAYPLMNRNEKLYYQQKSEIDLDYNQEDELMNNIEYKKEETKNELNDKMDIEIQNTNNKIHNKNINIEKNIYLNNLNNNSNSYIKPKYNNIYNNYLNDDNENNINNNNIGNCVPKYITDLFLMEKSVELFRICIRNNFQALPHVFIARGYDLMKAVEDCFNEKKFKLAIKLLNRSPYNETYQTLNNEGLNLFHILSKIVINNSLELSEILNILYSKEIPLDLQDIYGNTPLHYAAKNLAQYLISFIILKFKDKKNILSIRNKDNNTPFMLAIKTNSINNMTYTSFDNLFNIEDINELIDNDESIIEPLKNTKKRKNLISSDMNLDNIDNNNQKYKSTILLFSIRHLLKEGTINELLKYYLFYKKLIQNGASISIKDSYGKTCLHYIIMENNFSLLTIICKDAEKEIDKNIVDIYGKSLIHYCVSLNNFGSYENSLMLQYLLDNGFLSNSRDNYNKTPLDYALEQKTKNNLKILINKKVQGTENIDINNITYNDRDILDEYNVNKIPQVNFEQDGEEYYNYMIQTVLPSNYIKKPNLSDYHSEFFELYKENNEYLDASLTKVNLQNGIYGEYMFYYIQLVHDLGKNMYIVTTQFGRIGEVGANQRSPFNSLDEAKSEFGKIFKNKTGNTWEERDNFKRIKNKYMLLNYNKVKIKPNQLLKPFDYKQCVKSNIDNIHIKNLLKVFTDNSIIAKAFQESGVDNEFFNYSMLNKKILIKAREYLMEIYQNVEKLENIRKINIVINTIENNNIIKENDNKKKEEKMDIDDKEEEKEGKIDIKKIKTYNDKINAILSIINKIMYLSSRYYELIPKEKYKNKCILPLDNINQVKNEIQIIDNLMYVEKAVNILLGANKQIQKINPLDYIYYSLQTYFEVLEKESPEFETIEKYINNSSNRDTVENIYRITRKGETERINQFKNLGNNYLLFHGTKIFNLIGILSNGLKIAPPEAPMTGYLFGKEFIWLICIKKVLIIVMQ